MNALPYLLEKEFKQFLRNALLPRIALMVPLMVMLVAPLVATMDVRDVRVALVDHDRTVASRRLADRVAASPYFTLVARPVAYAAALRLVEDDRADVVLTIPADYGRQLGAGREPPRVQSQPTPSMPSRPSSVQATSASWSPPTPPRPAPTASRCSTATTRRSTTTPTWCRR